MKFRKDAVADNTANETREEVREMAEALSLYRSAMQHIAEREAARPFAPGVSQRMTERRPERRSRFSLLLAPALAAAVAAAVLVPMYGHFHHEHGATPAPVVANGQQHANDTHAAVDDTALMNQIDSEVSEDVPDALRPLADLSDQTTTTSSVSEKKNATQE
jgi:hypothetical protein